MNQPQASPIRSMTAQDLGWTYDGGLNRYERSFTCICSTPSFPNVCALSSLQSLINFCVPCLLYSPSSTSHHTHIHCSSSYVHTSLPSSLSSQDTPNLESVSCREGMYVRVVGHLRSFNKQRNMMAFHVRPVEDFNEVSHHLSEVIYTHLAVTKGLPVVSWSPLPSNH